MDGEWIHGSEPATIFTVIVEGSPNGMPSFRGEILDAQVWQLVSFIHDVRTLDLKKQPSVSETIDWARVLVLLEAAELGHDVVKDTLNVLLKYESDVEATLPHVNTFVAKALRQNVFG